MPTMALGSALNQVAKSRLLPHSIPTVSWEYAGNAVSSGGRETRRAASASADSIHSAATAAAFSPRTVRHSATPFQAATASELHSWLLASPNGAEPEEIGRASG